MSHLIQAESGTTFRNKYLKFIALTLHFLNGKNEIDSEAKDMVSFIILMLNEIHKNVDQTVKAWEKRDYWVKADHFRLEWQWCQKQQNILSIALKENNWSSVISSTSIIANKCNKINLSKKLMNTTPWVGAYSQFQRELR